jgi:hypothetical protein
VADFEIDSVPPDQLSRRTHIHLLATDQDKTAVNWMMRKNFWHENRWKEVGREEEAGIIQDRLHLPFSVELFCSHDHDAFPSLTSILRSFST